MVTAWSSVSSVMEQFAHEFLIEADRRGSVIFMLICLGVGRKKRKSCEQAGHESADDNCAGNELSIDDRSACRIQR